MTWYRPYEATPPDMDYERIHFAAMVETIGRVSGDSTLQALGRTGLERNCAFMENEGLQQEKYWMVVGLVRLLCFNELS